MSSQAASQSSKRSRGDSSAPGRATRAFLLGLSLGCHPAAPAPLAPERSSVRFAATATRTTESQVSAPKLLAESTNRAATVISAAAISTPAPQDALISVKFSMQTRDSESGPTPLLANTVLHTGDRFWFTTQLIRAAHVYALQIAADGSIQLLFPWNGDLDVAQPPGTQLRVPPAPEVFELDDHTGSETLLVVTSLKALASVDLELNELIQSARAAAQSPARPAAPVQSRPRPTQQAKVNNIKGYHSRIADRGIVRIRPDATVDAIEGKDGVAVIMFTFLHEP